MKSRLAALARDQALLARLGRIAVWLVAIALLVWGLDLLGAPVSDWIRQLFHKIREVPAWAVVAGVLLQSAGPRPAELLLFGRQCTGGGSPSAVRARIGSHLQTSQA